MKTEGTQREVGKCIRQEEVPFAKCDWPPCAVSHCGSRKFYLLILKNLTKVNQLLTGLIESSETRIQTTLCHAIQFRYNASCWSGTISPFVTLSFCCNLRALDLQSSSSRTSPVLHWHLHTSLTLLNTQWMAIADSLPFLFFSSSFCWVTIPWSDPSESKIWFHILHAPVISQPQLWVHDVIKCKRSNAPLYTSLGIPSYSPWKKLQENFSVF